MSSLRERKKEQTRQHIITVAAARVVDQGVDATTMEDVAAAAEVSVGTLYNYFGSKSALLLAVVADDVEDLASRGAAVLEDPGLEPADAAARIIDIYLDIYLDLGRDLMREVVHASFGAGVKDLLPELIRIDEQLMDQLRSLITRFRGERLVTTNVPPEDAVMLLFSIVAANLMVFVSLEDLTEADIRDQVRRQVQAAFRGLSAEHDSPPDRTAPAADADAGPTESPRRPN